MKELVDAMRQIYVGIPLPETISMPPPEDVNAKKLSLEACLMILKYLQETEKKMPRHTAEDLVKNKNNLNWIRTNV